MHLATEETEFFSSVRAGNILSVQRALKYWPYLISQLDEIGKTPLHIAVECGLPDMVGQLIAMGASVDIVNNQGATPFLSAIEKCLSAYDDQRAIFTGIAGVLLDAGSVIGAVDMSGLGALHFAAVAGDKEIVTFLLEHGANPNQMSPSGFSPLHWGLHANIEKRDIQKHLDALDFLIQRGADVNAKTFDGEAALVVAAKHNPGCPELTELLCRHGAL